MTTIPSKLHELTPENITNLLNTTSPGVVVELIGSHDGVVRASQDADVSIALL